MKSLAWPIVAAVLALIVVACGGDSDADEPGLTPGDRTPQPAPTGAVVSLTTVATTMPAAERPTATPEPATPTPAPTDTPTATPELPTATPVPPTATPVPPTATIPPPPPTAPPPPPATATPVRAPSGPQALFVTAVNLKFSPATIVVSAGSSVAITMNNQDRIVPHNVSITGIGTSETCQGPCTATLSFVAPAPGTYGFVCTLHPTMRGTLVVE